MTENYRLRTPEAVTIAYPIAGIGTRFLAAAIDGLVFVAVAIAIALGSVGVAQLGGVAQTVAAILGATLFFLLFWGYFIAFETLWSGQTPGKRRLKIRVLKTSGYPIGFVDALIRNLIRIVDWLPSFYGIGIIVMFISPQSRRLGDYAAGTIVVRESTAVTIATLEPAVARARGTQPARGEIDPAELRWDLRALTPRDLQLVTEYLDRAPTLKADARRRLGTEIASRLADRIGASHPLDPIAFLERLVYLYHTDSP